MERQPLLAGAGIALVGYTSSFAVVLAGLRAVGADESQATSGLVAVSATTAIGTLWLSRRYRRPLTLAWSTPGAAVLASAAVPSGGWAAAVGAFLVTGVLIVLTGSVPALAGLIQRIPAPIAQAMLAGVVLELCLAPVTALRVHPWQVAPILLTWLLLARVAPRWAVPAAFAVLLVVVGVDLGRDGGVSGPWLPHPTWTTPHLTLAAVDSIALPLYVVTMAAQNVPGVAILKSFGFEVPWRTAMAVTGLGTVVGAPLGGHAINLAAISAAVPASAEAHPDPERRWPAASAFGGTFVVLAVLSTPLVSYLSAAPTAVVASVAGVGLLGTLGTALAGAVADPADRTAPVVTFVVAASGFTVAGIGPAFWALVAGLVVHAALRLPVSAR
ncbi:MAG: benzoate/H(+) symporter BenE family transporter [Nocardioides sp.]